MKMRIIKNKITKNEKNKLNDEQLIETRYNVGKYEVYEQTVLIDNKRVSYYNISITAKEKYYPRILLREDIRTNKKSISIETTSYGSLDIEEYKDILKKYTHAVKVAETIKEYFKIV